MDPSSREYGLSQAVGFVPLRRLATLRGRVRAKARGLAAFGWLSEPVNTSPRVHIPYVFRILAANYMIYTLNGVLETRDLEYYVYIDEPSSKAIKRLQVIMLSYTCMFCTHVPDVSFCFS